MAFHRWNEMTTMATSHFRTANVFLLVVAVYCSFLEFQCCNQGSCECDMSHSRFFSLSCHEYLTLPAVQPEQKQKCVSVHHLLQTLDQQQYVRKQRRLCSVKGHQGFILQPGAVLDERLRPSPQRPWIRCKWEDTSSAAQSDYLSFFLRLHVGINQLSELHLHLQVKRRDTAYVSRR